MSKQTEKVLNTPYKVVTEFNYPSIFGYKSKESKTSIMNLMGTKELNKKYSEIMTPIVKNDVILFGEETDKELRHPQRTIASKDRYNMDAYKILSEISLIELLGDLNEADMVIALGIPSSEYKNKQKREKYIKTLEQIYKGQHIGKKLIGYDSNGNEIWKEKIINVVEVKVLSQPVFTYFYTILDEKGTPTKVSIVSYNALIIDIGQGTTDVDVVKGSDIIDEYSFSKFIGVEKIHQLMANEINNENQFGYEVTKMDVFKQFKQDYYEFNNRERMDIREIKEKVIEIIAEEIYSFVNDVFANDYSQFNEVIITGGGAEIESLSNYLAERIPKVKILENGQTANVEGMVRFATMLATNKQLADRNPSRPLLATGSDTGNGFNKGKSVLIEE